MDDKKEKLHEESHEIFWRFYKKTTKMGFLIGFGLTENGKRTKDPMKSLN